MTKVIENIELLKKLQPYLEDMETEYGYLKYGELPLAKLSEVKNPNTFKTLTLEEAIELIPYEINGYSLEFYKCMNGGFNCAYMKNAVNADIIIDRLTMCNGDNILNSIEKMLEYLIENQLLGE